jgi:Pvc16 N-terminal domain
MIDKVLKVLRDSLDEEINDPDIVGQEVVDIVIDNIAKEDNDATATSNKIVITLLNVEEETTLKNNPRYERLSPQEYVSKNPPAYLNLYVMIAANRDNYEIALRNISKVIEIVQTQKVFVNTEEEFKFKAQMQPLPFDQLSYVWGLLGGKILPSAFYKVSIIKIQKAGSTDTELITTIDLHKINIQS